VTATGSPPYGALVVSLDFELHWGVRDKHSPNGGYRAALLGAREVVPRLLALFEEYGVRGTWATVGFLFAGTREELEAHSPVTRPTYRNRALDAYAEPLGKDEVSDPLHFARSLVDAIERAPGQELATHTFCHYYCLEPGQTAEAFAADLDAAVAIAAGRGARLSSIVFPRNQHNPAYSDVLRRSGIRAYRGNPSSWMWRFESGDDSVTRGKRLARLLDNYANLTGHNTVAWNTIPQPSGLSDVRASRFLRPYSARLRPLDALRSRRIRAGIRAAAVRKELFHLWWHPHNMGVNIDQNLAFLRGLLDEFALCREKHGMRSLTMSEVDDLVRSTAILGPGAAGSAAMPDTPPAALGKGSYVG
jgi:peptidoglycan/xylan/chitin deacetylase (PgdA/CDA1 family)